ncbi:MAG: oligosaccharide flippase family protein [Casimicrobium sp.]
MSKFARALAAFGAGSVVGTLTQVVKGKVGAVALGVEGVGVFTQLTNAWSLLYTVSGLGYYNGIVRQMSRSNVGADDIELNRHLVTALVFLTSFSVLMTSAAGLLSSHLSQLLFNDGGARASLVAMALCSVPVAIATQTYAGLASAKQLVKQIVTVQVVSDLASLALFVVLVQYSGLSGAVLSFGLSNLLKLVVQIWFVSKKVTIAPVRLWYTHFRLASIRENFAFGMSGLLLVTLSLLSTIAVSRWIVLELGVYSSGLYAVAWRVSSLYFGVLYASASGYYFPLLAAKTSSEQITALINEACSAYMYALAPIAICLIVGAQELLVALFSAEFAAAAALLILFVCGDIFRVSAETIGLSLLAQERVRAYSVTYVLWLLVFLGAGWMCVSRFGLVGLGYAYVGSHCLNFLVVLATVNRMLSVGLSTPTLRAISVSVFLSLASALVSSHSEVAVRYLFGAVALMCWFSVAWLDPTFQNLVRRVAGRSK